MQLSAQGAKSERKEQTEKSWERDNSLYDVKCSCHSQHRERKPA